MRSPLQLDIRPDCLVIRFPQMFECVSWAPWNCGEALASAVVNRYVNLHGPYSLDSLAEDFRRIFKEASLVPEETIGLMTAVKVQAFTECFLMSSGAWVHSVATVGLTNARSVLDEADVALGSRCSSAGTVNLVVAMNALPTIGGRLEAIHIATSAKAAAFRDGSVQSRKSDRPADLTGTDCLVVGASGEIAEDQCGLHTVLGEMIGRAVYTTVTEGIAGFVTS